MKLWKLGCHWGSHTPLFYDFIKEHKIVITGSDKIFKKNDWILIADGHKILAFAKVNETMHSCVSYPNYKDEFDKHQIPFDDNLLIANADWIVLNNEDQFKYQLQQGICKVQSTHIKNIFNKTLKKYTMNIEKEKYLSLLKQKKQIILQGPPGTGKTRMAKQLALAMCNSSEDVFSDDNLFTDKYIAFKLKDNPLINSANFNTKYQIDEVQKKKCRVTLISTSTSYDISYNGIRKAIKDKLWFKGKQEGGLDPYNAALAKYLIESKESEVELDQGNGSYSLIQFHPSYTYEDFVRGIVVKNNGNQVEYSTENKILGDLAEKAYENYNDSKKDTKSITEEQWIKEEFEDFKDFIIDSMDSDNKYVLNNTANIINIEGDAFRYTGNTWKNEFRMKYSDIMYLYLNNIHTRKSIKKQENINPLARTHATYFKLVLDAFILFMKDKKAPKNEAESIKQKNYVLIIDEINRANLPNVLGELIYALEYRGSVAKSMYDIDGVNDIIIPPNLYIIGTMNTADRSVGHIDYAIRRRFAFVEILPKLLKDTELLDKVFMTEKFIEVSSLFLSNLNEYIIDPNVLLIKSDYLSDEFRVEDIWLGHSYFIAENEEVFKMKLEYEIKPILKEYVKDGILDDDAIEKINNL